MFGRFESGHDVLIVVDDLSQWLAYQPAIAHLSHQAPSKLLAELLALAGPVHFFGSGPRAWWASSEAGSITVVAATATNSPQAVDWDRSVSHSFDRVWSLYALDHASGIYRSFEGGLSHIVAGVRASWGDKSLGRHVCATFLTQRDRIVPWLVSRGFRHTSPLQLLITSVLMCQHEPALTPDGLDRALIEAERTIREKLPDVVDQVQQVGRLPAWETRAIADLVLPTNRST